MFNGGIFMKMNKFNIGFVVVIACGWLVLRTRLL
jgi:hypothetical protein